MKPVPSTLKIQRERVGLSQLELGRKMGVTQQTICRWEAGNFPIDMESVERLEEILETTRTDLFPTFFRPAQAEQKLPHHITVTIGRRTGVYKLTRLDPSEAR